MSSEEIRETLSLYIDGELSVAERAEVEAHLETSAEARDYLAGLHLLRRHLRYEPADTPDVTDRVLSAIETPAPRKDVRWMRIAAVFVTGIIGGAAFIGLALRDPAQVEAADLPARVLAAQTDVSSLSAQLDITERGRHPSVPERTFRGAITYTAPESIWIEIVDTTVYPSTAWVPNNTTLVVSEDVAWTSGPAGCPTESLPDCTPRAPRLSVLRDREPFPDAAAAPLDIIVPATGFTRAGEPVLLGVQRFGPREGVGVVVTAAQVGSLLDGLTATGNWRDIHPTDRVELWLDSDALVPLALFVFPADTPDRRLWAIRNGYGDDPVIPILEVTWSDVVINGTVAGGLPPPPATSSAASAGFQPGPVPGFDDSAPLRVPEGMRLHRTGVVVTASGPSVSVASWSDGRAWLKIRSTSEWGGGRLFGDLGTLVRPVALTSGVAYVDERGERVAIHADELDVVVTGSLDIDVLLEVAASLGIVGLPIPDDWADAATATIEEAAAAVPGLILPGDLDGFGPPAVRVEDDVATLAYAGPGNRGFQLAEAIDGELSPPLESNVRGVTISGIEGRYSPDRGLLEWIQGRLTVSIRSATMSLDELITIAESLAAP